MYQFGSNLHFDNKSRTSGGTAHLKMNKELLNCLWVSKQGIYSPFELDYEDYELLEIHREIREHIQED